MSQYYRIVVSSPATKTRRANTFTWTSDSNIVQSCDVELHKEAKRISTATIVVSDARQNGGQFWPVFNALPDPALSDVPVQVYLAKPGENQTASKLVFDGKMTSLQAGFPAASHLTIVAHDRSIDLRANASYKTFLRKTSKDIAAAIGNQYGLTVDASELVGIVLTQRMIDIGMGGVGRGTLSDYNHVARALAVDGLELYIKGKKLFIRKSAQVQYPHTFRPDDGIVASLNVTINHVSGPGAGGQFKQPQPGGNKGTQDSAAVAGTKAEADAEKASATTHRRPPQGPDAKNNGAHTESTGARDGSQSRKRKDEAELTLWATPDLGMQHLVNLSGWGGKADGIWHIATLHHSITGSGPATTTAHLTRAPSDAAQKGAGTQPQPGGSAAQPAGATKK